MRRIASGASPGKDPYERNAHVDEIVVERPVAELVAEHSENLVGLTAFVGLLLVGVLIVGGLSIGHGRFFHGGFLGDSLGRLLLVLR